MLYFADYLPSGEVRRSGCAPKFDADMPVEAGCQRAVSYTLHIPGESYWNGTDLVKMSQPPSRHHVFDYATKAWGYDDALAWADVRALRDQMMTKTDWISTRARDLGEPVPQEWLDYRQALRDITNQPDPTAIQWPVEPSLA